MRVCVEKYPDENLVVLRMRARDDHRIGDTVREVRPGETYLGRNYEEWMAVKGGGVDV